MSLAMFALTATASIAMIIVALFINLVGNLFALRRLDHFFPVPRATRAWPLISVLIPARDEAPSIEQCLRSILAQDYPAMEVLVLDDESTDGTDAIVMALAAQDPKRRLRLLRGGPLPHGWLGKGHACVQLAAAARGDYLLFTDADTLHGPHSLANALAAAEQRHVGLISALPQQQAVTFGEQLLLPLLPFTILTLLPVWLVRRRPEPSLSAGIGQFMFLRREAYVMAGGHGAVRDQVLDDVMLARNVKATGWRMDLVGGGRAVRCRMYRTFPQIWRGFSKNLYDFYGRSPLVTLLAVVLHITIFVAPLPLACLSVAHHLPLLTPSLALSTKLLCGAYLCTVAMRLLCALLLGGGSARSPIANFLGTVLSAVLHPVADAIQCAITLNSMRWRITGQMQWKGRFYARQETAA